jgi:geranylgeranyl reductase family protein
MATALTDVVVVGAGPAGSSAAITLARLGRSVVLIDKAVFPRDKCCGDGLTTAALRRLRDLGLDPTTVESWEPVGEAIVVPNGGPPLQLPLPVDGTQFAAAARRTDLDAALVRLAITAGIEVIEGSRVTTVGTLGDHRAGNHVDGVAVGLDDGRRVAAHYVIAADGMWSSVRKAVGLADARYLGEWQAGRQYFANVGPDARKLWVWFEPDMIPGYAWSFPLPGGTANVGYGLIRRDGRSASGLKGQRVDWRDRPDIARVLGPDATPIGPWKAWPIPARIGRTPLSALGGRVLFAGDAAAACDPMTGEGIAQALETGEMAARAAVRAGPGRPSVAAARYRRQVHWGLAVDDRLSRDLSRVLNRPTGSARALRIVDAAGDWGQRNFARWMFEDYPRALLVTPHRWARGILHRPGAYQW